MPAHCLYRKLCLQTTFFGESLKSCCIKDCGLFSTPKAVCLTFETTKLLINYTENYLTTFSHAPRVFLCMHKQQYKRHTDKKKKKLNAILSTSFKLFRWNNKYRFQIVRLAQRNTFKVPKRKLKIKKLLMIAIVKV